MLEKQKERVLTLLKADEMNKTYENRYWFHYKEFLDTTDNFTSFSCEELDGKQGYITLIENLLNMDETAKIFVEVYGFEENNQEQYIYAETLIIFCKLLLHEVKQIFNEPEDIFPSDIGEVDEFSQNTYIIDRNGDLNRVTNLLNNGDLVYYCWWD